MNSLRGFWKRLAALFRRDRRDADLAAELDSHLQFHIDDNLRAGMTPDEARRQALIKLGGLDQIKESYRDRRGLPWLDSLAQDIRFGLRMLRKNPGFTTVAVLALALGVGANASVFSLLDAVLLKSLPVRNPNELRIVTWARQGSPAGMKSHSGYSITGEDGRSLDVSFSYPAYESFRDAATGLSGLVAFAENQFTVTAAGTADLAFGHYVSGNYFTVLGTAPLIGRPILPDDDASGKPPVAVLSYQYWTRRFGRDPSVVGQIIVVNQNPAMIVGVMPPAFQGLQQDRAVDIFVPMSMVPSTGPSYYSLTAPDGWWVQIFGRLKSGASSEAVSQAFQSALDRQIDSYAGANARASSQTTVVLEPGGRGSGMLRGSIQNSLYILAAIAALVLLIACTNLASLLLARYASRSKELAVRTSLGASRWRLLRQMLTESFLLATLGAAAGLLISRPLLRLFVDLFSGTSVLAIDARIDVRTLSFAAVTSISTVLLFGAMPAWGAARRSVGSVLKETASNLSGRTSRFLTGRYLVSIQIALSLPLLVGAGLFLRTIESLASVDLGFHTENVLTFQTDPGRSGYKPSQKSEVYRRIESKLALLPGVEAVAMSHLPLIGGVGTVYPIRFPGDDQNKRASLLFCSDSFLSTMRIPILLGRDLTKDDFDRPARNVVVNQAFVKNYLPSVDPIGQIFYPPPASQNSQSSAPYTIVGVARDAHYRGVRELVPPVVYIPYAWRSASDMRMVFMLRTRVAPLSLAPAVRRAVASVDENLPVAEMRTEQEQVDRSLGAERLFAALVTTFGVIAIVLVAIGLYGLMAFTVSRRTSEIGIRIALGAQRSAVQWLILRQSLSLTLLGILAGVASAFLLSSLVAKLLFGVKPYDPISMAGAVVIMIAVAACAAWLPAARASRVDPVSAMRCE